MPTLFKNYFTVIYFFRKFRNKFWIMSATLEIMLQPVIWNLLTRFIAYDVSDVSTVTYGWFKNKFIEFLWVFSGTSWDFVANSNFARWWHSNFEEVSQVSATFFWWNIEIWQKNVMKCCSGVKCKWFICWIVEMGPCSGIMVELCEC